MLLFVNNCNNLTVRLGIPAIIFSAVVLKGSWCLRERLWTVWGAGKFLACVRMFLGSRFG